MGVPGSLASAARWSGSAPVAVALLVGANLIPLVGVLLLGWDVLSVLVMYWLENGLIGLLNIARMALAAGPAGGGPLAATGAASKVVLIPFFAVHYGIFWAVHGVFVFALPSFAAAAVEGSAAVVSRDVVTVGALALAISHGASFVLNYLGRGEYRTATVGGLFVAPYGRVVVLHLTVLLGGFVALGAGSPVALVALLVILKTAVDLVLHLREHAAARRRVAAG